jgi:hypothetical protein
MEDTTQAMQTTGDGATQAVSTPGGASATQPTAATALVPKSYDQLERFAETIARSRMVPKQYRHEPEDVMVAVMHGMEIGLKPLQALQNIAMINGKPSIYGDAAIALVRASPVCAKIKEWREGEGEEMVAYCYAQRSDGDECEHAFDVTDAKKAGLWDKKGPWSSYPQRMLQMRARSWVLRDLFADVLQGLYIAEEARDIPSEDEKRDAKYEKLLGDMREGLEEADDFAAYVKDCKNYISKWPPEQQAKAEALIADVRAARSGDVGERPQQALEHPNEQANEDTQPTTSEEESSFKDDLATLEQQLGEALESEAPQERVSELMEQFSEAYPQPPAPKRNAIMEVYEPVRAELAGADEEAQSQAADDILEGNTALNTEEGAGGDGASEGEG